MKPFGYPLLLGALLGISTLVCMYSFGAIYHGVRTSGEIFHAVRLSILDLRLWVTGLSVLATSPLTALYARVRPGIGATAIAAITAGSVLTALGWVVLVFEGAIASALARLFPTDMHGIAIGYQTHPAILLAGALLSAAVFVQSAMTGYWTKNGARSIPPSPSDLASRK
ncbi:hypothetical protein [Paenibacillus sp. GYB003]|uniref:hypothetical protein n=1 Tax=Paenibacillus sp. GYB003 TaxID=2994392 RepID=UPI002F96876E